MLKLLLVGAGGFMGSVMRYLVSGWVYRFFDQPAVPYGTLVVNVLGCVLIGFLAGLAEYRQLFSPEIRMLILVGFLGGFTTYSTFGYESFQLLHDGQLFATAANIALHLVAGIGGVWLGSSLSRLI